ncbi:MAG TPA: 23S rRNA (uracil(1939)-C(5))-methyltransferase RlmD [Oscillospiraceae bacterium]|nr:23S rRNA (uracil(1939)-C(5))-methyltransferase RlmD [Oscillospiraceae bacterium]HNW04279.1 23S rRNA (uracil(1939)-C(5))-methyltransferase RlmD [Oscillospiraceae bacterium]
MNEKVSQERPLIEAEIVSLTDEGRGVAKPEGRVLFVPGAIPGDRALVRVEKAGKSCLYGKLEKLLAPSPDRIEPDCPYFPECGGCSFRNMAYTAELRWKTQWVADHLKRIGGFDLAPEPALGSPETLRCRNKAIYPAGKDAAGKTVFGFYRQKSHELVACKDCLLQPAEFARILEAVAFWADGFRFSVYDEKTGKGFLRAVYLRKGWASGEILLTVVANGESLPHAQELVSLMSTQVPQVSGIVLNVNRAHTNVMLGEKSVRVWGGDTLRDTLSGVEVELAPGAFYQVNHDAAELLYAKAAEFAGLTGDETVLDLYCGAGTIGLSMAAKAKRLIGAEIVPEAVENAKRNAMANGVTNAEFLCADAAKAAAELKNRGLMPDVVVLDPPRKGCSPETLDAVAAMAPSRIVMVACDTATLARDLRALSEKGYRLRKAQPVDLFPRTANVECVALMTK